MALLERHVELFNQGVRSGDFASMLEQFSDDAELVFEGSAGRAVPRQGDDRCGLRFESAGRRARLVVTFD